MTKNIIERLIMNFRPRRRLGKFFIMISVVFVIAALYTLFFFVDETSYVVLSLPERVRSEVLQHLERSIQYPTVAGPNLPSPYMYSWPYRWLSKPLAIVGIFLFLIGLLIGYHDDISEVL